MLAAAGLGSTWLFGKARILAIFDDLDTVLLMIPLKVLIVGLAWQLGFAILVMAAMLSLALNLALTGVFIVFVKKLVEGVSEAPA